MQIIIGLIIVLIIIVFITSIKIIPQSQVYVVERMGEYNKTLKAGLHVILPIIDRVQSKLDIREQVLNFPPQPVITKDNVTMKIDVVVYTYITDPKKYCYGVGDPLAAVENLAATTLRNIIGDLELDETLTSRDVINTRIRATLDDATEAWGLKITRVEVKNIIPPKDIQEAMEKQMRAEREKREKILIAEGQKTAAITEAEGIKESTILKAEADKQQAILKSEGEAEAILKVQEAYATSLKLLNDANPSQAVLQLKGYEAFEEMAKGDSAKLIIPSEMSSIASLGALFKEGSNLSKK